MKPNNRVSIERQSPTTVYELVASTAGGDPVWGYAGWCAPLALTEEDAKAWLDAHPTPDGWRDILRPAVD